jgi:hypothetical protein
MHISHKRAAALAIAAFLATAGMASAQETKFMANLTGGEEVPPVETAATGMADVTWNAGSKELSWSIEFDGLSGPATAAHFHGPAAPGENAGPVVPIEDLESPSEGTATLTDEQAAQLAGGQWYVNVHTAANPDGEIRGQVTEGSM